jgi:hypothetical protein
MPKISELTAITSVANTDLLMVVHDPSGAPSTNKITVGNFTNTISRSVSNILNYANNTSAGVIKVGDNLTINSTGFLSTTAVLSPTDNGIDAYTYLNNTYSYVASVDDTIIYCNPNAVGQDITITLPMDIPTGKNFKIKNIDNAGGGLKVIVTTSDPMSNYIEDPVTGALTQYVELILTNDQQDWVFDGSLYRHTGSLTNAPVFLASQQSYHQVVLQNNSDANNASSDWVAYNDQGNFSEGTGPFIDMGINSSQYTDTYYGDVWGSNDAYLYNQGGNLIIASQTADSSIKLAAGNTNQENVRLEIHSDYVSVNSNIYTTKPYTDFYGLNQIEFSATTNGDGGGNDESWIWMYQDNGYAETGTYVQNTTSWSESVHRNNGAIQYYGEGVSFNWDYTIRGANGGVAIKPHTNYMNELTVLPTGDYDVHLFESGSNGAITLGNYGQTNFRVYGPGGIYPSGEYSNDIRAELVSNSSFLISTYDNASHEWKFNPDGSFDVPNQSSSVRTGSGQFLKLRNNSNQKIIGTENGNVDYPTVDRIVISGGDGYDTGEGGDVYLWAGRSGLNGGSGGDIKVDAGNAYNGTEGGTVKIRGGNSDTGIGGFIEVRAGTGGSNADIRLIAGNNQWTINENATLSLPVGGDILNSDGYSVIKSIPQNQQSSYSNYTLQLSDAGKHVYKDEGDGYGVEVPTNASVAFAVGTVVTIVSGNSWTYIYPADGMTTEVWGAGYNTTSSSFYIPENSMATLLKIGTDKWMLSGAGLGNDV